MINQKEKIFLSVVIPTFNEEKTIITTLNSIFSYLKKQNYSFEVIVVNDCSRDYTRDLVIEFQKSFDNLILIDNERNEGKGFSVRRGMLEAQGELAVFMDADNSTKIEEIAKALPFFEKNETEVVIASRRLKDSRITKSQSFFRKLSGEFFRIYTKVLFDFSYDDTQAGFKVFNCKGREVFKYQTITRWSFDVELLWLAKKMGFRVKEIPIDWEDNPNTHVKLSQAIKFPLELLKIRLGKYKIDKLS